jgi:CopG family nickel-responsive transcriptional regulator
MEQRTMEGILVQGPARRVAAIADEIVSLRGIVTGRLQLMAAVIPQVHPLPGRARQARTIR